MAALRSIFPGVSSTAGGPSSGTSPAVRYQPVSTAEDRGDDDDKDDEELDDMAQDGPEAGADGSGKPWADTDAVERADALTGARHRRDAAAALLRKTRAASDGGAPFVVSLADSQRVLRRIDWVILPIILTVYFLQALDKATLAYASVFGLIEDTGLTGDEYSWLGSVVYLAQLVMQPLLAWLLVKLPLGKFTSATVLLWGATLACMAAAHDFRGLIVTRFFLGAFEAGVAPSFIAITQMWWRRREQTVRVSYWYAMNGITNMARPTLPLCVWRLEGLTPNAVWKSDHLRPWPHPISQTALVPGEHGRPPDIRLIADSSSRSSFSSSASSPSPSRP